jgi:hypothetical protein
MAAFASRADNRAQLNFLARTRAADKTGEISGYRL